MAHPRQRSGEAQLSSLGAWWPVEVTQGLSVGTRDGADLRRTGGGVGRPASGKSKGVVDMPACPREDWVAGSCASGHGLA